MKLVEVTEKTVLTLGEGRSNYVGGYNNPMATERKLMYVRFDTEVELKDSMPVN